MDITVVDALFGGGIATILITLVLTLMSICSFGIIIAEGLSVIKDIRAAPHVYAKHYNQPYMPVRLIDTVWERLEEEVAQLPATNYEMTSLYHAEIIKRHSERTSGRLSFLASIGANAPFIGLFGTVVGVMGALTEIGKGGIISATEVGPPVGEALVMTAFGLLVAVPAVFGYNMLLSTYKRRNHHIALLTPKLAQPETRRQTMDASERQMVEKAAADLARSVKDVRTDAHGDLTTPAG